ncbi:NAD(P)/FAD-dependent oxidoreductase [Candidatus Woesearchaeota archaeon]|nr:NAD(P)/FAD-dependent oxidoreductase [Candidatus Woesearchaeota archaeon]
MVAIIGAGPAGSFTAYCLAKAGQQVDVFEEHSKIGNPIQCSGVITPVLESLIHIKKEIVVNKIKAVRFYAPNKQFFDVKIKEDYVFDRSLLDQYVAEQAEKAGARFHLNSRFNGLTEGKKIKYRINNTTKETDILIGADGPYSKVAKEAGMFGKRTFITGMQARAKATIENKHRVEIFLGYGEFGWLIPENESIARIGIVDTKDPSKMFYKLLKEKEGAINCFQSGMIPLYNPKVQTQKKNIYLVGDAAAMVKAPTHGGILFSLLAGQQLAKAIAEKKNYESLWREKIGKDLWLNLKIRNVLCRCSEKDLNLLVQYFQQEKLKSILRSHVRDFPTKFTAKLFWREPRLLRFAAKGLRELVNPLA